jgi:hypothetical protein
LVDSALVGLVVVGFTSVNSAMVGFSFGWFGEIKLTEEPPDNI